MATKTRASATRTTTKSAPKRSTRKPAPKNTPKRAARAAPSKDKAVVAVATRKGVWLFHSDASRRSFRLNGPHFLGHIFHHVVIDPRDGRTLLAAAKTGHLGPTIFRSTNLGKSWTEASKPPAFAKVKEGEKGRTVNHTFWLTPGHASEPGVWYAGTSPQGIFRSEDGGATWEGLPGVNDNQQLRAWMGAEQDGTPDGPKMHSLIIDPRDRNHMYFGMSSGGVHESKDAGKTWALLIGGLEVVGGFDKKNPTFHDPHCVRIAPSNPDRLYQQNHCGIYRLDRPGTEWTRIGRAMPAKVGDIGFPMVVHPRDADTAWVFPMDGTTVWPRTSPGGAPAVYATTNGGKSWQRKAKGLPTEHAWWTVKRQAMTADALDPVGLYFGTTSGSLWMSRDEGERWSCVAEHLPEIYAVDVGRVA